MEVLYTTLSIGIGGILLLMFLLALSGMRQRKRKYRASSSSAAMTSQICPFLFRDSPGHPMNERILEAIQSMNTVGENAEGQYQASLEPLRRKPQTASIIISAEYRNLPIASYMERWTLVQLLAEIGHPASLRILDDILSAPMPIQAHPREGMDPLSEELFIRTTAVDAVAHIAAAGHSRAVELLFRHVRHEHQSVRRACIQAYLRYGGNKAPEQLLHILQEDDYALLDIRHRDVSEMLLW